MSLGLKGKGGARLSVWKERAGTPGSASLRGGRNLGRQVRDGVLDLRAQAAEGGDGCERYERGGDCVLGKLKAGLVAEELLQHLVLLLLSSGFRVEGLKARALCDRSARGRTIRVAALRSRACRERFGVGFRHCAVRWSAHALAD